MTAERIFSDNRNMYNRLFWLDWISRLWAVGASVYVIYLIVETVMHSLPGAQQTLSLPVDMNYPRASGAATFSGVPYVVNGTEVHFTQATMTLRNLGTPTVVLLGAADILAAVVSAGIAWCLFRFVSQLRAGEPFAASTARSLSTAGWIVGVGITLSNTLRWTGESQFWTVGFNAKYGQLTIVNNTLLLDLVPLFVAGVLFALAGVFRYGAALQRETDGLV